MKQISPELAQRWAFMLSEIDAEKRARKDEAAARLRVMRHQQAIQRLSDEIKELMQAPATRSTDLVPEKLS
jgi:hypothetical protein